MGGSSAANVASGGGSMLKRRRKPPTADWAVTFHFEDDAGDTHIHEFYRGSKAECCRIAENAVRIAHSDSIGARPCWAVTGPAEHWDEFQREMMGAD